MSKLKLPVFLQKRFSNLQGVAWENLYPEEKKKTILKGCKTKHERKGKECMMKEEVEALSYLLLLFYIYQFFYEGTYSASQAIDIFKEIDIPGFSVGSEIFEERNANVMLGEKLADMMLQSIGNEYTVSIIIESEYQYQVINKFKELRNVK